MPSRWKYDRPMSRAAFEARFPDEASCARHLAAKRWPDGFVCPACGHDRGWELKRRRASWECAACGKETSVTAGTIMHRSHLPLKTWLMAVHIVTSHSNGISALQLQAQLGLGSYKSAWLLLHKLRRAMVDPDRSLLEDLVEIDEATLPFRTVKDPTTGGQGRSRQGKMRIAGAVELSPEGEPVVTLAQARDKALDNRRLIRDGGDPLAEKRKARAPTFAEAAVEAFAMTAPRLRSEKARALWMAQLERHALPKIGRMPVDKIGREDVLRVLTPIWTIKPETARKVRQRIRATLAWAQAHGHIEHNVAGAWKEIGGYDIAADEVIEFKDNVAENFESVATAAGATVPWAAMVGLGGGLDSEAIQFIAYDADGRALRIDRYSVPAPNATDASTIAAQERRLLQTLLHARERAAGQGGIRKIGAAEGTGDEFESLAVLDRRIGEVRARIAWFEQAAEGNTLPRAEYW